MVILGYMGILAGCGAMGLYIAQKIRNRPREIREFMVTLTLLDSEILFGAAPLPEAFYYLSTRSEEPWRSFFLEVKERIESGEGAGAAWKNSIAKHSHRFSLKQDDWRIIDALGKGLGRSDRQEQHKQISLILQQLELVREQSVVWAEKNGRMWSYLGFLAGMAMVILLI